MQLCIDSSKGKFLLAYLLGDLNGIEKEEFENHLQKCPVCRNDPLFQCVDPKIGCNVHLYFLDELSDKEAEKVETHLNECATCRETARQDVELYEYIKTKQEKLGAQLGKSPEVILKVILEKLKK